MFPFCTSGSIGAKVDEEKLVIKLELNTNLAKKPEKSPFRFKVLHPTQHFVAKRTRWKTSNHLGQANAVQIVNIVSDRTDQC